MEIKLSSLLACLQSGVMFLGNTLKVSVISIMLGSLLALIIALVRFYKIPVLSKLSAVFVTIYRGIPFMVILLITHLLYVLYFNPIAKALHLGVTINDVDIIILGYITITIGIIPSASETFRGALQSIDRTQIEASHSIGMTTFQSLYRVILPQMFPVAFPTYINNILGVVKGVPLLASLGIQEIMQGSLLPCSISYSYIEGYTATAIIYFVLIMLILTAAKFVERRITRFRY